MLCHSGGHWWPLAAVSYTYIYMPLAFDYSDSVADSPTNLPGSLWHQLLPVCASLKMRDSARALC